MLAATPATSVLLSPDQGLVLVHDDLDSAVTFAGVTSVDIRADIVLVMNERGSSLRLSQSDARPLGWMVPRSRAGTFGAYVGRRGTMLSTAWAQHCECRRPGVRVESAASRWGPAPSTSENLDG